MLKQIPIVKKDLSDKLDDYTGFEGNQFTVEQAIRVYLWNKTGMEVPGLSQRDLKALVEFIESEVKTLAYGFFAPIFFLWVGIDTDISYIIKFPLLILAVMLLTKTTKILSSYFVGRKKLGTKKSVLLGISLSVKFSTSIVIIKLLFENGHEN